MPDATQLQTLLAEPDRWLDRSAAGMVVFGTVPPKLIMPGSFNPLHRGHELLAQCASEHFSEPVALELSVANVDKPSLPLGELQRRLAPLAVRVCVTCAPLFVAKARLFPGSTFVIGADTAVRLLQAKYYADGETGMHAAFATIAERGNRFFVGGRVDGAGQFVEVDHLDIPTPFRHLFTGLRESHFRVDLSSTKLRGGSCHEPSA